MTDKKTDAKNVVVFILKNLSCLHLPSPSQLKKYRPDKQCLSGRYKSRGRKRIRTAVAAFAELSLATRPSDHGLQMYKFIVSLQVQNYS